MGVTRARAIIAVALLPCAAAAQVVTDGSVGSRATLTGPGFAVPDFLGRRVGPNLLHSFSTFNIRTGESATFSGPRTIENIIARITGGLPSTIDGRIQVTAPDASLYLVNPAGLVFGPGASIDVPGSFYASTAHTLALADGTVIDMRVASPVTLTAAPPSAFGFETAGAALTLAGSQLRVRESRRIGLVAGDVTLGASASSRVSSLVAPSGAIGVVATRGAGSVAIEGDRLVPAGFTAMGDLAIRGNSSLLANEGPARRGGGTVVLRGGDVTLDHAQVEARTRFAAGRSIDIGATGQLDIEASNVLAVTTGAGNAGSLRLEGRDIAVSGGSLVDTSCDPGCTTGQGGNLTVVAGDRLTITGDDPQLPTFVVSNSFGGGATGPIEITTGGALSMSGVAYIQGIGLAGGEGSSITLRTGSIDLSGGAQVDASTRGSGRGGDIVVHNAGDIRISGTRSDPTQGGVKLPSGFFVNAGGSGSAGGIVISTANLEVLDGGEISSTAQRGSTGDGGRIELRASGLVRVAGTDGDGKSAGIVANTFAGGDAGEIDIAADRLEVSDEGRVQTQSEGAGRASSISVRAREALLTGRGQISSDARAGGDGGTIDVGVTGHLVIEGFDSGIFAKTYGPARGGAVQVQAGDIVIDQGGIFAGSDGAGAGGNVTVATTGSLTVRNEGSIAANARSTGFAGNVSVAVGDTLTIETQGGITTEARSADGGDIAVSAGNFALVDGGSIATAVGTGQGAGGNITLSVPTLVLRGAVVSANAFGGPGGNIRIGTQTFFPSADSSVTASSQLGIDGTITLDSPALDPTGELLAPAPVFLDAGAVLAGRCGPRLAGRASSLVVMPRGDPTPYPDELRPILDGFAAGFLTVPAPDAVACNPAGASRRWFEARAGS
ncbi:MAG: filamentous hemagglutinin N-terminal domain-containing protein [Lysobacter sp.]|nr:filamentous hemagglutinin N-terminal domain-containing protein [Lysobacter sp.]